MRSAHNRTSAAVDRREWNRARRAVLAQCGRCGCKGTAAVNHRGRVTSLNLAAECRGSAWVHRDCGGVFAVFDIEVGQ